MHAAELQRVPRHCPYEHGGRHPTEPTQAVWDFLARHGIAPRVVEDPSYIHNQGCVGPPNHDTSPPWHLSETGIANFGRHGTTRAIGAL
jgi:hypothetical protein